jgi:hypothetical protein
MKLEIVKLIESASSDGYKPSGDGNFFLDCSLATAFAKGKYGNHADIIEHWAVKESEDSYYILGSWCLNMPEPVALFNSEAAKNQIKEKALSKLTEEEKKILGL